MGDASTVSCSVDCVVLLFVFVWLFVVLNFRSVDNSKHEKLNKKTMTDKRPKLDRRKKECGVHDIRQKRKKREATEFVTIAHQITKQCKLHKISLASSDIGLFWFLSFLFVVGC